MDRIHNSKESSLDLNIEYYQVADKFKPVGIWYGINNDWLEWCVNEMPHWIYEYVYKLNVDISNILIITNKQELKEFINEYENKLYAGIYGVDWWKVSRDFTGIELQNYNVLRWTEGLSNFHIWLSEWDVNGGCIWDLSVIKNIKRRKTHKKYFS